MAHSSGLFRECLLKQGVELEDVAGRLDIFLMRRGLLKKPFGYDHFFYRSCWFSAFFFLLMNIPLLVLSLYYQTNLFSLYLIPQVTPVLGLFAIFGVIPTALERSQLRRRFGERSLEILKC
jgi:hypothetical protein